MNLARRVAQIAADLWMGRIPLARVFWEYAIAYGTVLNLLGALAYFMSLAQRWPAAISFAPTVLSAPYNFLMIVAVWRSAAKYSGRPIWATFARAVILVWAALVSLI